MPGLPPGEATELLGEALRVEGEAQRALLDGDASVGAARLRDAAELYRRSWEAAGPEAYGRLIGHVKASVIAGDAVAAARYVCDEIADPTPSSPAAGYARAVAALVLGDRAGAAEAVGPLLEASPAFARAGRALAALAIADREAYAEAVREIVADFESRGEHLTGVPIADTALMLERLAAPLGLEAGVRSSLLPAA